MRAFFNFESYRGRWLSSVRLPRGIAMLVANRLNVPKFLDALVGAGFLPADTGFGSGFLPQHQAGFSRAKPEHPARRRYTRTFPRLGPQGILAEAAPPH